MQEDRKQSWRSESLRTVEGVRDQKADNLRVVEELCNQKTDYLREVDGLLRNQKPTSGRAV